VVENVWFTDDGERHVHTKNVGRVRSQQVRVTSTHTETPQKNGQHLFE